MIRPLFKVHEPFMGIPEGHGYLGVVMYDDHEDKVQCHICGGWYALLSTHLYKTHEITDAEYKERFGLPCNMALCSHAVSKAHRDNIVKHPDMAANWKHSFKNRHDSDTYGNTRRRKRILRDAKNRIAQRNKVGLCDAQMAARYDVVRKIVRHNPNTVDLRRCDFALLGAIERRHGTLNEYRKIRGEAIVPRGRFHFPPTEIVAALRGFAHKHKRYPSSYDWKHRGMKPSCTAIISAFGSWRSAMQSAGLR